MTLATLPVIGSTPDDTLLAALDSLLARPIPARSPMGAYQASVAKWAPDGFRESLARFRAGMPPNSLTSVGRILSRFLSQGGACEEATSPRAVTSMQPSSRHRGAVHRQSPTGLPAAGRAEHLTPLGHSRRVSCTPTPHTLVPAQAPLQGHILGKANRAGHDFRRPGCHRHRERAAPE